MSSRFRLVSVFLVATLVVLAGCSIMALRNTEAQGTYKVLLRSRHEAMSCFDIGTIVVDQNRYSVPTTVAVSPGTHPIEFPGLSGCDFVAWEAEGGVTLVRNSEPGAKATINVVGDGLLRVVFRGYCCSVGGVAVETNTLALFAPYIVAVGLIATTTVVVTRKRRD